MTTHIKTLHQSLQQSISLAEINAALQRYLSAYHVRDFAFTCYSKQSQKSDSVVEYAYVSASFQQYHQNYYASDYNEIDSVSYIVKHDLRPVFWQLKQLALTATTAAEKEMREQALAAGFDCGLSIPLFSSHGQHAVLMLQQSGDEDFLQEWQTKQYEWMAAAHYYYSYLLTWLDQMRQQGNDQFSLSKREMQCLLLVSESHTVEMIARKLFISERTVNFHIQRMNKKFGVKNKHQSVLIAREAGVLR